MSSQDDPGDLTGLNEVLSGTTVEAVRWWGPYRDRRIGESSARKVEVVVRLRDGRRASLGVLCRLSDTVAARIDDERAVFPLGTTCLRWEPFDPGLVLEVGLYLEAGERWDREHEDDPLAEAVAPLWEGTAAAPLTEALRRVADVRERLEAAEASLRSAVEELDAIE